MEVAKNLGRYLSCTERTADRKDSESILTVKMETRHPIEGSFGSEFLAFCNHCIVMAAWSLKTWKFCEQFLRLKKIPLKLSLLRGSRPKSARAIPHIWLTLFQISSKSVHFWQSYCRTGEDLFCSIENFKYRLFEPIIAMHNQCLLSL